MVDFYDQLSHGLDKGKAMQNAKIRYMESADPLRQQPYYWAGYIVTGDPSPVFMHRTNWLMMALAILLPVIVFTILIRNHLKKQKLRIGHHNHGRFQA